MKAVILCGGLGTRLGNLTKDTPKPLLEVAGKPFIAHVLNRLKSGGIDGLVLAAGFQWAKLKHYIGDNWDGVPVHYSIETHPLGTGGAIKAAMASASLSEALVFNGDTLFDIDIASLLAFAHKSVAQVCISLRKVDDCSRYGRVTVGANGEMLSFGEKGYKGAGLINGGIYYLRSHCLHGIKAGSFSLESDFLSLQQPGHPIYGMPFDDYFIDIGIPSDLQRAEVELRAMERS
ncbi:MULTISPECIES: nucleotidyltransferase family protein [unclassified Cyanobium]|uniref:nucleotidyltransferase family protein n=1 Tax=unclassified Cyanobium TaxID=2627006 RepID=UPI0020CE8AB6|nr:MULTISPECIES: nucleotidyltransferase family protein [unclassified Cyanobium]MCP9860384.1 nucleotidyltransferase family protein [Cyanobium sp. Cruz-8H5]MCP9867694.1 nucleotidyltransferase family protein [Cyanobium sp. Cruz-8D1]